MWVRARIRENKEKCVNRATFLTVVNDCAIARLLSASCQFPM
jgi:hypothetical protein